MLVLCLLQRAIPALICVALLAIPALLLAPPVSEPSSPDRHTTATSVPLRLQWIRELPPLEPAWSDQPKMHFDEAYEPVVADNLLLVASSRTDGISAYNISTGTEEWTFFADGPVRFAPTVWEGHAYCVSDDGYLYCIDVKNGKLHWKFRGGPAERKILGNGRLISTWPARGAPAVADGTVYFAAGIWPFMGIFIHALDARTGKIVWSNSGDGAMFIRQPHQADSFAGVAPQGRLVVAGDRLLIPGGRSVPACYDRKTGKLLYYQLADNSQRGGGHAVLASGRVFVNGGHAFDLATGDPLGAVGDFASLQDYRLYCCSAGECKALDLSGLQSVSTTDRKGEKIQRLDWQPPKLGTIKLPGIEALLPTDDKLFVGSNGTVAAYALPLSEDHAQPVWTADVAGKVVRLVAGEGRLFAVTIERSIFCFAPQAGTPNPSEGGAQGGVKSLSPPTLFARAHRTEVSPDDSWTSTARKMLEQTHVHDGYCIAWGAGSGRLVEELLRQSRLHVIVIEKDASHALALRKKWIAAEQYGSRVSVHVGSPGAIALPPYLASLMVSENLQSAGIAPDEDFVRLAFASLRPFGGVAWLALDSERRQQFGELVKRVRLPGAFVREVGDSVLLSREGALPGSANWTHEHADAANTRVSHDTLVKAPLGVLWFGGHTNEGILPRHGHGPQPQVIDGRMIIEGVDKIRALDIYTGRVLWETELPGVGQAYNNTSHQPGANASGSNFVSTSDGIYVLYGEVCLRLDLDTGKKLQEIRLPGIADQHEQLRWTALTVQDRYLVGGASPAVHDDEDGHRFDADPHSASKYLVVVDRHDGALLWHAAARTGFRNNSLCVGGGRIYCIDRLSGDQMSQMKRRGEEPEVKPRLIAFDLKTGHEAWSTEKDVFGTWLCYSEKRDVLIETGRVARDTLSDEPSGMRAYRAADGAILWHDRRFGGPALIHGDLILKDRGACDLRTGAVHMRKDPITGREIDWTWTRTYGCNIPAASENLLTFRSGAAGYFDLQNDGGTGNFGGFRSSCTNNLIVAGGLLVAPDYTRTCNCSYQNQSSIALVNMPEAEMWTYQGTQEIKGPIQRVGINLGAPGDRKATDGTLWLEYPSVGGPSPRLPIKTVPEKPDWFCRHSATVAGDGLKWVAASGARGLRSITITLDPEAKEERNYTVRLHFLEPDEKHAGDRLFDVQLQGKCVLERFDVAREAGGANRALVKEFTSVRVIDELTVTLTPCGELPAVLSGIEIIAERP